MISLYRRFRLAVGSLIILSLACGGAAPTKPPAAPAATPTAAPAAQPTPTPAVGTPVPRPATPTPTPPQAAAARPVDIHVALFALQGPILDPIKTGTTRSAPYLDHLFDGLTDLDAQQNIIPALAASWTVSPDGLAWDFKLRPGARFHDGSPVTPQDIKFQRERFLKDGNSSATLQRITDRVEVVGADTVRFAMKQVWASMLSGVSRGGAPGYVFPKGYFERVGEEGFKRSPVGSGPFRFVGAQEDIVRMEAWDGYYRGKPQIRRLVVQEVPEESTRVAMLKTGETDVIEAIGLVLRELRSLPNVKVFRSTGSTFNLIHLYGAKNPDHPFHDLRVRQALNYAIDKEPILKTLFLNEGEIMAVHPFTAAWLKAHNVDLKPYPYDPEKARQLLREAGFGGGLTLPVYTTSALKDLAVVIQADLAKVGVKLDPLNLMERGQWVTMRAANAGVNPTKVTGIYPVDTSPPRAEIYPSLSAFYGCAGTYSPYCNAELDKLIEQAQVEANTAKRQALEADMARIIHREAMNVFLVTQNHTFVTSGKIAQWDLIQGIKTPSRMETIVPAR